MEWELRTTPDWRADKDDKAPLMSPLDAAAAADSVVTSRGPPKAVETTEGHIPFFFGLLDKFSVSSSPPSFPFPLNL